MKMRNLTTVALLLGTTWACGQGVHEADDLGAPVAVIRARIEGTPPMSVPTDDLHASMIWAALPEGVETCMEGVNDIQGAYECMGALGLVPALGVNSVPVEPVFPAAFEVPIHHLPDPSVLGGSDGALFGYAILVVHQDGNGNDTLDPVGPTATESADTVVAASTPPNEDLISFVVYREGALSSLWKFFSLLGCPEIEPGFSVVTLTPGNGSLPTCSTSSTDDATVPVFFDDSEETRQLICEAQPNTSNYPSSAPPAGAEVTCFDTNSLSFESNPGAYCDSTQYYDLAGCDSSLACEQTEWDLRDSPPNWWPCNGLPTSADFTFTDDPSALTTGADTLFTIRYDNGTTTYPIDEIKVWVETGPANVTSLYFPTFMSHDDADSDGKFSLGDVLTLFEPAGLDILNESHSTTRTVELPHEANQGSATQLAEFLWTP